MSNSCRQHSDLKDTPSPSCFLSQRAQSFLESCSLQDQNLRHILGIITQARCYVCESSSRASSKYSSNWLWVLFLGFLNNFQLLAATLSIHLQFFRRLLNKLTCQQSHCHLTTTATANQMREKQFTIRQEVLQSQPLAAHFTLHTRQTCA